MHLIISKYMKQKYEKKGEIDKFKSQLEILTHSLNNRTSNLKTNKQYRRLEQRN